MKVHGAANGSAERAGDRSRHSARRALLQFASAGLVALLVVAVATAVASRNAGRREAINAVRNETRLHARAVAPLITGAVLAGDDAATVRLAEEINRTVLGRALVRSKIWRRDGSVVFSDEPRLIGRRFAFDAEERALFGTRRAAEVDVSDLSAPENQFEQDFGQLVEAYIPIRSVNGEPLLFEVYFRDAAITSAASRLWSTFVPWTIGALVVLQIVQLSLAWSLGRRLGLRQREREDALRQALHASAVERRQIAADLHDGVVQSLAGVALEIGALARRPDVVTDVGRSLEVAANELRDGVQGLRSLLVEIYPPNLFDEGLIAALSDLAASVRARGIDVRLRAADLPSLPRELVELTYRVAQESLRNVSGHARATSVGIELDVTGSVLRMRVFDDGIGFDPDAVDVTGGHLGLRGLRDLVADAGGRFVVTSRPNGGTIVALDLTVP